MAQESKITLERARRLLRATLATPRLLPTTEEQSLVWAIRIAVFLGVLVAVVNAVDKPLWDWLQLLIVPAVIAAGVAWFSQQQRDRELETAERRSQDEALEAYFNQMADLILHENLLELTKEGSPPEVRERLERFDRSREELREELARQLGEPLEKLMQLGPQELLRRLLEVEQRGQRERLLELARRMVQLQEELQNELQRLRIELLQPLMVAKTFTQTTLGRVDGSRKRSIIQFLHETRMISSERTVVVLHRADLSHADLSGLNLADDDLSGADLSHANLGGADLTSADLSDANLRGVKGINTEQLAACKSLEGATMPNGQKYEDWLKEVRGEDGENSGLRNGG
jgi:hypothetical protein